METSTASADYTVTFDEDESLIDMQPSGKTATNFYPFTLKNGTAYTLAVQTDLFVVQQATKVLLSILPYVILMVFLLSLLCAWLYTRYITRPIVQLSKISKQMAELDFSGQCSTGREDELGCLAQNLNSLSASLSTALNDLQAANQQLKTDIEKEQRKAACTDGNVFGGSAVCRESTHQKRGRELPLFSRSQFLLCNGH